MTIISGIGCAATHQTNSKEPLLSTHVIPSSHKTSISPRLVAFLNNHPREVSLSSNALGFIGSAQIDTTEDYTEVSSTADKVFHRKDEQGRACLVEASQTSSKPLERCRLANNELPSAVVRSLASTWPRTEILETWQSRPRPSEITVNIRDLKHTRRVILKQDGTILRHQIRIPAVIEIESPLP